MPLILARRGIIRPPRGPFAFPGTKPDFDSAHFAAAQTRMSAVAVGGSMVDLLTGKPGGITGAPTNIPSQVGPSTGFPNSTDVVTFTGKPAAAFGNYTFGCIAIFDVVGVTNQFLISSSNSGVGVRLSATNASGSKLSLGVNGLQAFNSTIPLVANVPYALFGSYAQVSTNGIFNCVATRLDNGVTISQTLTQAATTPTADSGTCAIGNRGSALQAQAHIAAAMYSTAFIPLQQLVQWAADPWSFWYPR